MLPCCWVIFKINIFLSTHWSRCFMVVFNQSQLFSPLLPTLQIPRWCSWVSIQQKVMQLTSRNFTSLLFRILILRQSTSTKCYWLAINSIKWSVSTELSLSLLSKILIQVIIGYHVITSCRIPLQSATLSLLFIVMNSW